MSERLAALRTSVEHLRSIVDELESHQHETSAYPSEWTIADTMSHLGSGAVISKHRLEEILDGLDPDPGFNQATWDAWNAMTPSDQVAGALEADRALLDALEATTADEREGFHFVMGPFNLDFEGFVGLRLNENALHTWDVEVTFDPAATLPNDVAGAIIDNLSLIVGFVGKSDGTAQTISVRTTNPTRDFDVVIADDTVRLVEASHGDAPDIELPAEAFVRLVYGRLDADTAPDGLNGLHLERLQKTFPGF